MTVSNSANEAAFLDTAEQFIHGVAAGDWDSVRPLVSDDFITSEVYVSPDWLIQSFGNRDWSSAASLLADHFVAGPEEMDFDEMVEDLSDHYGMFAPEDCEIQSISLENGPAVVCRATHIEIHEDVYVGIEPSGEPVAWDELTVLRFDEGEIKERRVTFDLDQFHVQLGIRPGRTDTPISQRGTQVKVQQQFYRVLNRLLRHNIRNDLTYVRGYAEVLADNGDESADRIISFADDLINTAEKVRLLEDRVLNPGDDSEIDVVEIVESVVEEAREEYPESNIEFAPAQDTIRIRSNGPILDLVLNEVMENAIVHNDAQEPIVEIELATDDSDYAVIISIADNGPGIPDHEITPLEEEVETSLEHASGIGVWAIKWGVEQLGGKVSFEANEPRGTIVRMPIEDFGDLDE